MKLPTEAELIELENRVVNSYRVLADSDDAYTWRDRVVSTLEALIALARDPSELLRTIPDDADLDRKLQSLRTSVSEPSPSARPKRKARSKPISGPSPTY